MNTFYGINDPYIAERLYGITMGCALRCPNPSLLQPLGQFVYDKVFCNTEEVYPNILLRNYARVLVEFLHKKGYLADIEVSLIAPPYRSQLTLTAPSMEQLSEYKEYKKCKSDEDWSMVNLYSSIFNDDFSRYVIGERMCWLNIRIGQPMPPTIKESFEDFVNGLDTAQKESWNLFETARKKTTGISKFLKLLKNKSLIELLEDKPLLELQKDKPIDLQEDKLIDLQEDEPIELQEDELFELSDDESQYIENPYGEELSQLETEFIYKLTPAQRETYETVVRKYFQNHGNEDYEYIETNFIERWIFSKVLELGWTPKRFGTFDRYMNRYGAGREPINQNV